MCVTMGKRNADNEVQYETPNKTSKYELSDFLSRTCNDEFSLSRALVDGTILTDLSLKDWRIGKPVGKGNFGEIFLASDDIYKPVTSANAKYVVKIEPHTNGPLFVEIHCLINTAKRTDETPIPPGMPEYIASGSHYFQNERYRFLILHRYKCDLHSLIKNKRVDPKSILIIAGQILDVLEHLHDKGYAHSDIKAENLMLGDFQGVKKEKVKTAKQKLESRRKLEKIKIENNAANKKQTSVEFSGSNPVRSCRVPNANKTYQDMVKSHYLRPLKNIVYCDGSDDEQDTKKKKKKDDDTCFYYSITTTNVSENYKNINIQVNKNHAFTQKPAKIEKADGEHIYLIDFGLASKFLESTGQHRVFCMDQRRAHDGTLEFTSRDAHMGAHARRSDLEVLGYNLVFWSQGFLPWKDEKMLHQPEQVHRMKEYFMTDVKEMLKLIYGEDCPKYLGEFLLYVANLTYDERPDYNHCRSIFQSELKRLDINSKRHISFNRKMIATLSTELTVKDEEEIIGKIENVKKIMKFGQFFPYRESTLLSKSSSPKNLRSKRDKKLAIVIPENASPNTRKKEKDKIVWAEILSTDPDQIARKRAEKEFERGEQAAEIVNKYSGNPTYAILEIENRLKNGQHDEEQGEDFHIKGYTKAMMTILKKRQSQIFRDCKSLKHDDRYLNLTSICKDEPEEQEEELEEEEQEEEQEEEEDAYEEEDNESAVSENENNEECDSGNDDNDDVTESDQEVAPQVTRITRKTKRGSKYRLSKASNKSSAVKDESYEENDSDFINDGEADVEEEEVEVEKEVTQIIKRKPGRPRIIRDPIVPPVIIQKNRIIHSIVHNDDPDKASMETPRTKIIYQTVNRRKNGLRTITKPAANKMFQVSAKRMSKDSEKSGTDDGDIYSIDDTSCSSINSSVSAASTSSGSAGTGMEDAYSRRHRPRKRVSNCSKNEKSRSTKNRIFNVNHEEDYETSRDTEYALRETKQKRGVSSKSLAIKKRNNNRGGGGGENAAKKKVGSVRTYTRG